MHGQTKIHCMPVSGYHTNTTWQHACTLYISELKGSNNKIAGSITGVDGKICEKPSLTWSGKCGNTQHCDKQCQSWEGAKHGACHSRGGWKCFCYFDC